ncbi:MULTISPECIES: DNA gyrase subunit A [Anaerococcus]|uniref:DNA gyrase subunit A n=1 Tax=Anaerococcus TaxID=165779 RepID=UPI001AEB9484|nr:MULTISPECIES: DNA gyrase subunit A [Anaerococcus]MBP2070052.1 DNA gyrase subunit A [Anaerococcus nagyae]MDU1828043.1 DNA gyrase subunit A [Anaerococcus sp.]MDU1864534.1 DNA gyrase subunit A [Anaerococcus sp.]MDU2565052.1 DNA gyrase subunit A [Anaerococcus sp.]MDU3210759.1 DNA gyrase subunit A [Anaerococcus sp.]
MIEINNDNNIINVDLEDKMKDAYLDYSMSVIVSRALPDVRDGLKPVHRRILYGMDGLGLDPSKPTRKSARVVGEVMGKYHPHGDSAIYDALVRLAQDFSTRYPLAQGQGNFGSIDGDDPAAMRYTEVKMSKIAKEMLRDINKDTVDFMPNFDEEEKEPIVLPSRFPNLLVNGSNGIAVGMATNMAPHNLNEAIDASIAYMKNPEINIQELNKIIKGPDFPTGAKILGKSGIKEAYETGRGKVKLRGIAEIEPFKKNRERIIVSEIPYQVNKARLIEKIADLVKDKRIDGISDIRDESDRKGMRIVIEIKRDANANIVLNNLYKYTQLETTFGIINLALVDGVPKILNLKELIKYYIDHQKDVVTRRTEFDLARANARKHIVEGLIIAIDNIDEIIKIIRSSYDDEQIKGIFLERFGLTDLQSQAILDMRLKRLSGLEIEKLNAENKELEETISYLRSILDSEEKLIELIEDELNEIKEKYGDKRRTKIVADEGEIDIEELIEKEDILITLTNDGYIKRLPVDTYKVQNRGGKGISAANTKEDDFIKRIMTTNTHEDLLFFTSFGRVYSLKGYQIPEGSRTSRGQAIINILSLNTGEKITEIMSLSELNEDDQIVLQTKNGKIKKTDAINFTSIQRNGIIAIGLEEDDKLISARHIEKEEELIISTKDGMTIQFNTEDVRSMGRQARGVRAIKLSDNDEVVAMNIRGDETYLLVVTENGFGKKTSFNNFNNQNRGGKGIRCHKVTEKTGCVVDTLPVDLDDDVLMVSLNGDMIRIKAKDISTTGRNTMGVTLKNLKDETDKIVSVAKYDGTIEVEAEEENV